MSNPSPSVFDVLLSGARAAAAKKHLPPSSSLKKRKFPSSSSSPWLLSPRAENPNNNLKTLKTVQQPQDTTETLQQPQEPPIKRMVAELKEKVPLLKKEPQNFDPSSVVCWEKDKPVPFLFLSLAFNMIDEEKGRVMKTHILCNLLRTVIHSTPDDLVLVVYLSANRIAPPHQGLELGIGDVSIIKALADACGRTKQQINAKYKLKGDLGLVAQDSRRSSHSMWRKPKPLLTIRKVFNTFRLIAKESGKESQEKKRSHIKALLVAATDCEPLYLIRLLQAKLRIGYAEQTLLAALSQAAVYNEEHSKPPPEIHSPLQEAAKIVKKVYSVLPDYDKIVAAILTDGVWELQNKCGVTPGVPVGPMLSIATKGIAEILHKFQDVEFTCEYKYDGERAQIHYLENGSVEIYSRNAERITEKFPDVVAAVSSCCFPIQIFKHHGFCYLSSMNKLKKTTVSSFIIDCEIVAYDRAKQKILSFQVLSTRARKNVAMSDIKVNVCVFPFDLLYLNGQALLQDNLRTRREHLYASFEEESGFLQFATSTTSNDAKEIQTFLNRAIDASCEGLIIKTLHEGATYEPSKRSLNWLKLKKDYMENTGDSLDLVPIGAFHGRGKRAGVYGAYLVACYDKENGEFQSIVKLATGFKAEMLEERSNILRSKIIPKPKTYYKCGESINPDVWFEDSEVWEVKAADLTISPVHRAAVGIVDSNKGISLRFPRFVRVRPDKAPEQATSSKLVARMYNKQKLKHTNNQDDDEDDD